MRRLKELVGKGIHTTYEEVLENIESRDRQDENRKESPLRRAHDAIDLDNTDMTIQQQDQWLIDRFNEAVENIRNCKRHIKEKEQPFIMDKKVEIDSDSGFCFGVVTAIKKAEEELAETGSLYCLGDIVHNSDEVQRLSGKGLKIITHEELEQLKNVKVLLRAHGEPPSTYQMAKRNNIEIIDATCPVVLRLQQRIKKSFDVDENNVPKL